MKPISTLPGRALAAAAILVIALVLLAMGGLVALAALQTTEAELEARQSELELLQRRPLRPVQQEQATATMTGDPFLEGSTLALAGNALQQRLVSLVETAGGRLLSVGVEPPIGSEDDSGRRAVVQASAEMTIGQLQTLLYRLEGETPFLFVEALTLQRADNRIDADLADRSADPPLRVELRVAGVWRGISS